MTYLLKFCQTLMNTSDKVKPHYIKIVAVLVLAVKDYLPRYIVIIFQFLTKLTYYCYLSSRERYCVYLIIDFMCEKLYLMRML
ncbi:unnamed protein product [Heterobilharzia americana]|nr:unnamed protein product [Heterobilharzia americana]